MAMTTVEQTCAACKRPIKFGDRVAVLFTGTVLRQDGELVIDDAQRDSSCETLHRDCYRVVGLSPGRV